jgi:GR25 family glycosyltransferase involved in LPS biosynthesis
VEVLYFNLERRPDRNDAFLRANAGRASFRRLGAVDGRLVRPADLAARGLAAGPLPAFTPGALGCALSHHSAWELCAAGPAPITVAEDDAVLNRHFAARAPALLAGLTPDWDLVLWGWNFDSILHVALLGGLKESVAQFDPSPLRERLHAFGELDYPVLPLRLLGAFGTLCYSVSPKGARRLLACCFPLRDGATYVPGLKRRVQHLGIDVVMNGHYRELEAYVAFPPLAWSENEQAASDVGFDAR